jgi:PAS domain-containing protein/ABC-type Na+ transport system ATPase subunit NatA
MQSLTSATADLDELTGYRDTLVAFRAGETRFEYEADESACDGTSIRTRICFALPPSGRSDWSRVLVTVEDITEAKKREQEITALYEGQERLITTANAPIFGVDSKLHITDWNRKAAEISGFPAVETMGKPFLDFIEAEQRASVRVVLHEALRGEEALGKVIVVDQSPIGRTPRSNPATYTGIFSQIRDLFASLPASKIRGYGASRFSFNVKGGRCEKCQGGGLLKIEMNFLPPVYVTCESCKGRRYNRETLEIHYKGRNIADVLDMTVDEAMTFFRAFPKICDPCATLSEVGLGYLKLGQQGTTLSGGEAQRVKLATELTKQSRDHALFILDEPTTGLHFHDIARLIDVLVRLRDANNTLVVIEHNMDIIKSADWVIDLGPEGGNDGGRIVAEGPPERVAAAAGSHTGRFLAATLGMEHLLEEK